MAVRTWVVELVEGVLGGPPFAIGEVVWHPSGRRVQITDGQYWGEHGLSNFWHWREVLSDGTLAATVEHGYGWRPESQTRGDRRRRPSGHRRGDGASLRDRMVPR